MLKVSVSLRGKFLNMCLDYMRGYGTRCPPIVVVGLSILCLFVLCNWWSLSSQNSELIKQLDSIAEQLRINGNELGKCSQERQDLNKKFKDSENKLVQQQIKMEHDKEAQEDVYQKFKSKLQESKRKTEENWKLCQVETESLKQLGMSKDKTSEALRTESKSLKSEMEQKDKQIRELEQQLQFMNKTCGLLENNKLMQSMVKNYNANTNKNIPNPSNLQTDKEVNNKEYAEQQLEGDSGVFSVENDPREEEMKGS